MRFTDQHGRKWSGNIEIRSGYPIRVSPRFEAPLVVPPKYLKYDKEEPNLITIAYEEWVSDIESAHQRWEEHLRKGAIKFYGEKAPEAVADPPAILLNEVGQRPEPVEPVLAALSGNKWILGLSDRKPAWADTYFATPAPKPESMDSEMPMEIRANALAARFPDADAEEVEPIELPNFGGPSQE
jgi:hypothetical protein